MNDERWRELQTEIEAGARVMGLILFGFILALLGLAFVAFWSC
jgi:hypothetical protein